MYPDVLHVLAGMFLIATIAFLWIAGKFWSLRGTVIISVKEMAELLVLLSMYKRIEKPQDWLARMLKMDPKDVEIEIEKGRIIDLVSLKATKILERLKSSVPEARDIINPVEELVDRG